MKAVVSFSGGLDSTVMLYDTVAKFKAENVVAVSFYYGQRHSRELKVAKKTCKALGVKHITYDISFLSDIVKNATTLVASSKKKVDKASDVEASKKNTAYVPFRNLILISILSSVAEAEGANVIRIGIQNGDYANHQEWSFWDCQPQFIEALQNVINLQNPENPIKLEAPFVTMKKADIVSLGYELGVDFRMTHTCYAGKAKPCGVCASCVSRANAFKEAGLYDPLTARV